MTTTAPIMFVHPETGELLDAAAALEVARGVAVELVAAKRAADDAAAECRDLDRRVEFLKAAIRGLIPVEGRVQAGNAWVVVQPGKPMRRCVNTAACDAYREQLLTLGLGSVSQKYRPPTISQVDAARAELTAAGVPISEIAPTPGPYPPEVVIVDAEVPL